MHPWGALQQVGGGDGSLALGTVEVLVRQKPSQLRKHVLDTPTKVVLKVSLVLFTFFFFLDSLQAPGFSALDLSCITPQGFLVL